MLLKPMLSRMGANRTTGAWLITLLCGIAAQQSSIFRVILNIMYPNRAESPFTRLVYIICVVSRRDRNLMLNTESTPVGPRPASPIVLLLTFTPLNLNSTASSLGPRRSHRLWIWPTSDSTGFDYELIGCA